MAEILREFGAASATGDPHNKLELMIVKMEVAMVPQPWDKHAATLKNMEATLQAVLGNTLVAIGTPSPSKVKPSRHIATCAVLVC